MPVALLLSMQAAGMIFDYMGTSDQAEIAEQGARLQQMGLEQNIYQTRLESENNSLAAMKKLRQTIGTQLAVFGARGTNPGAGNAVNLLNENIGNFNAEEKTRRINEAGKELQIRTGMQISKLQSEADNNKLWSGFMSRTINRFPSSVAGWSQEINDVKQGFGLTSI